MASQPKTYVVRIVSSFGKNSDKLADDSPILAETIAIKGYSGLVRQRSNEAQYLGANYYGFTVYAVFTGYTNKAELKAALRAGLKKHYGEWGTSWVNEYSDMTIADSYEMRNFEF
jgi:hypothetical protein